MELIMGWDDTLWDVRRYPKHWRTSVTVSRGGLDRHGDPLPDTVLKIDDVVVGWGSTEDQERSDAPTEEVVMYLPVDAPELWGTDLVDVPLENNGPSGLFQVDGVPRRYPLGVQVALRKV